MISSIFQCIMHNSYDHKQNQLDMNVFKFTKIYLKKSSELKYIPLIYGLIAGALGGFLFYKLNLPLPWLLGAMFLCVLLNLFGFPLASAKNVRPPMSIIMGVMLGASFTPKMLDSMAGWPFTLLGLFPFLALTGVIGIWYFHKINGYDFTTAYFCAMPGGLYDMALIGSEMGGDTRKITLVQSTRIMLVVFAIPFWFQFVEGTDISDRSGVFVPFDVVVLKDALILGACGLLGMFAGHALRLPAPFLLGSVLISGMAHLSGFTAAQVPTLMTNVAQVFLGISLGCRFAGSTASEIGKTLMHSLGFVILMLLILVVFANIISEVLEMNLEAIVLAYSPAGILEMGLIAIVLGVDAAFVATHHIFRVFIVITFAPLIFRIGKKVQKNSELLE